MALPAPGAFAAAGPQSVGKAWGDDLRDVVATLPGAIAETELTIAAGSVTGTGALHRIDTEAAAGADDLANLLDDAYEDGAIAFLRLENAARLVKLKHQAGGDGQLSLRNALDLTLRTTDQVVALRLDRSGGTDTWYEIARFGFGPQGGELTVVVEASGPRTLTPEDSGAVHTIQGAAAEVEFNLPTARAGLTYTFVVQDVLGVQVNASGGDTLRLGAAVSAAGGRAESTTVGDTLTVVAINATEWIAVPAVTGGWVLT